MMNIVIMRGLPGSGKSTWVKNLSGSKVICSADDFHMMDGEYRYNPKRASEAHDYCLRKYLATLQSPSQPETLVVDNTNVTAAEIAPYARLASAFKIPFRIVYTYCDPVVANYKNVHGVPIGTILRMHRSLILEEIPPYWPQEIK